ncbi:mannose-1-phosphate guanyltransferase [Microbotryomycetes sp. JL221]|nr:mannose-1-phosphate guanyltransferase [Microbotryomycetes sp. JL221]
MSGPVWLSQALGWTYFFVWTISFYPQAILNWRRKSVQGLSIDFLTLNPFGFACYSVYTIVLASSPVVRQEYASRHHGHAPQVQPNDIAFAVHALLNSLFQLGQAAVYKRDRGQKPHAYTISFLSLASFAILVGIVAAPNSNKIEWLDLLYLISYIKITISLIKLLPQALLNYQRKSTIGWSIENILLDMTGGLLSLLQLFLDAWIDHQNNPDSAGETWLKTVFGNPGKLGLSVLAIFFDLVFVMQHFVWYRDSTLTLQDVLSKSNDTTRDGNDRVAVGTSPSDDERRPLLDTERSDSIAHVAWGSTQVRSSVSFAFLSTPSTFNTMAPALKALILVGGFGTRLRPLTLTLPKPLVEFPMIMHQVEALVKAGVKHIVLAVNYRPEVMVALLSKVEEQYNIKITFSVETEPLGTAGPLALARDVLGQDDAPFFVLNSDVTCSYPFEELRDFHMAHGNEGTIMVTKVEDPSKYGVVVQVPGSSAIDRFVEKPKEFVGNRINAGIYIFNPSILNRIEVKPTSIEQEVFPAMVNDRQLHVFDLPGFWMDVGQPKDFITGTCLYLTHLAQQKSPLLAKDQPWLFSGNVLVDPTAQIDPTAVIGPNVVVGPGCKIGAGVRLQRCVVMENSVVKDHSYIVSSICGWNCTVGKWVRIEQTTVLGDDVTVKDEKLIIGASVLPHKSIRTVQLSKGLDGRLSAKLPINYGEKITYKYVVDGTWQHNPLEPTETDGSGNTNNVFTAPDAPAPTQVADQSAADVAAAAPQDDPLLPVPAAIATNDASTLATAPATEKVPTASSTANTTATSAPPAVAEPAVVPPTTTTTGTSEPVAAVNEDKKKDEEPSVLNVATAGVAAAVTGAAALAGAAVAKVTGSSSPLTLVSSKDEPAKTVEAPIVAQDEVSKEPVPTPAVVPSTSASVSSPPAPAVVDEAIKAEKKKEAEHEQKGSAPVVTAVAGGAAAVGAGAAAGAAALNHKASETTAPGSQQRSSSFQKAEQRAEGYMQKAAVEADKYKDQASTEFNKRYAQGEQMAHNAYDKVAATSFGASTMKALGLDKNRNEPQPQSVTAPQPVIPAEAVAPAIPVKDTTPSVKPTSSPVVNQNAGVASAPAVAASSNTVPAASQAPAIPVQQQQQQQTPLKQAEQTVKNKFNELGNGQPGQQNAQQQQQSTHKARKPSFFKKLFGKDKS